MKMLWTATCAAAVVIFAAMIAAPRAFTQPPEEHARFLYLPAVWADRVVFYHSFEQGVDKPEINTAGVKVTGHSPEDVEGFAGRGYRVQKPEGGLKRNLLTLDSAEALSAHRPLTIMHWWRLDEEMQEDLTFNLIFLQGRGWISNSVHGKAQWCGLREPTYISQVHGFAGIRNYNNPWGGRVFPEKGAWHHVAMTFSGASTIRFYWDGRLRETIAVRGREFAPDDTSQLMLGAQYSRAGKPDASMTIDEVIIVNRALNADEVSQYAKSSIKLKEVEFVQQER